jgi:uncharacterized protein
MEFEWDEAKCRENLGKHGLDFRDAPKVFQGVTLTAEDKRQDYGETRLITLGMLDDIVVVMVHTFRGDDIRIISMRKAKAKERKLYEEKVLFRSGPSPEPEG